MLEVTHVHDGQNEPANSHGNVATILGVNTTVSASYGVDQADGAEDGKLQAVVDHTVAESSKPV